MKKIEKCGEGIRSEKDLTSVRCLESHWKNALSEMCIRDRIQSERFKKPPDALEEFLKNHPEIKEIEICTDNDFAGRWAKEQMKKHYEGTYQIICNLPEKEGEDYADLAKEKKQANKCRDRPLERR